MKYEYDTARPYIASYLLIRRGNKLAFVLRSNTDWMKSHYGLPSGKVEKGESFTDAVIREAKEEIGIGIKPQDLKYVHTAHRHEETDWVDVYFEAVKWSGEPYNAEPQMHSDIAWLNPNDLPTNTIPATVFALKEIGLGKYYSEYGWTKD